jgi:hypothetical protein
VAQSKAKAENVVPAAAVGVEDEIAYLAKRHRVTPAIVREIMRRSGASERARGDRARGPEGQGKKVTARATRSARRPPHGQG